MECRGRPIPKDGRVAEERGMKRNEAISAAWDRGKNNCRDMAVGHVSNVPGTMESCPTHCLCSPWAWFVLIAGSLGSTARAAEVGRPQPTPVAPAREPTLVEKALRTMDGAEEIVFVARALYSDGHYYANFGGWSDDPNKFLYPPDGSRLGKLNLRTKQATVLLDDPQGNIRDPRVHYDGSATGGLLALEKRTTEPVTATLYVDDVELSPVKTAPDQD